MARELGRIDRPDPPGWRVRHARCASPSTSPAVCSPRRAHSRPAAGRWRTSTRGRVRGHSSCPSRTLCVAVDDAGRVLTARNPSRGMAAWTSGTVRTGGLLDVSCPSVHLCVAVGGADVAFSTTPRQGARSWKLVRGVDQALPPECGTDGPGSACGPPELLSVSCPSASYCAASDSLGSRVRSTAPGSVAGWPRSGTAPTGLAEGAVACLDRYRCLTMCASGAGFFSSQCPGYPPESGDIETLSSAKIAVTDHLVSPEPLTGLWCPTSSLCFAADAPGALIASRDPANTTSSWST